MNTLKKAAGDIMVNRPRTIVCYICGREYGKASIEIHLKTCKKKWEELESQKPPRQRRALPQEPPNWGSNKEFSQMSPSDIQNLNEASFKSYNTVSLVPCNGCGRTFNPESLEKHMKGCHLAKVH